MPEKKKQHYIPKMYMKLFANDNGAVNIFNIKSEKKIPDVPYADQCYKDYYYGHDLIWENKLGIMEKEWDNIFLKLSKDNAYSLDSNDISLIRQFALYQRHRTVGNNEYLKEQLTIFHWECLRMKLQHDKVKFTDQGLEKFIRAKMEDEKIPQDTLDIAQSAERNCLINDLSFLLINYKTRTELIISDNPIILINKFDKHNVGYISMGLVILFPITPHKLIVFYDSKMYPKNKMIREVVCANDGEVKSLNVLQFINAEKILIYKDEFTIDQLVKNSNENIKNRNIVRQQDKVFSLGTSENKMIGLSSTITMYDFNLSFCSLPKFVKKIPEQCREAAPRKYDPSWGDKFKMKEEIFPVLVRDGIYDCELSLNELKRGLEEMTGFANYYWKL